MTLQRADAPAPRRRLLVVVSHDFGELGSARDFLRGLDAVFDLHWLLPRHLFHLNPRIDGGEASVYAGGADLVGRIGALRPAAVLCFSAYLLVADRVVGLRGLRRIVRETRRVGARLITSDPFLGLTRDFRRDDLDVAQFPDNRAAAPWLQFAMGQWTAWRYRLMDRCLRPAAVVATFAPPAADRPAWRYFQPPVAAADPGDAWVFVISAFDLRLQFAERGEPGFGDCLRARLHDAAATGRPVCLVAPPALRASLAHGLPRGVSLAPPLDLAAYQALLASAGRVFYWNMVSQSLYDRFVAGRAIHFFDRGHVARVLPRLYARAVQTYFGGHEPPLVDFDQPLDEAALAQQHDAFRALHQGRLRALAGLPTPSEVLAGLGLRP
jgi:hypothetical protein